jgi:dihydrolipoamide dehydrogenase
VNGWAASASTGVAYRPRRLLRSSEIYHYLTHLDAYGLSAERPGFDLAKIVGRSRKVADQLNAGVRGLMKKHRIDVHEGVGTIRAKGKLTVVKEGKATELTAKNIIVATGARARDLALRQGRW